MSKRNFVFFLMIAAVLLISIGIPIQSQESGYYQGVIAGRNVNMVAGTQLPDGDPWLQRQNEPSIAVSTRNPLHLLAGANDYRTIDMPGLPTDELPGQEEEHMAQAPREPWVGVFKSFDGGHTWISMLLPGFPQDASIEGLNSPLRQGYWFAAADPVVRAGANGMFYYCGIAFHRATKQGVVFVARFIDNNNKENGDPIKYLDTKIIATGLGDIFIDKPWIAVDRPRFPSWKVSIDGQSISRHNVYLSYSAFTGEGENLGSQIMFARSTDCGETWNQPFQVSLNTKINQGSTIAVLPKSGTVVVAWRVFGQPGQPDQAIYATKSPSRGHSFRKPIKVASFYSFDQPSSGVTFRTNSYPTMTVDDKERIYIAWSQRHWGPDAPARIVISTSKFGYLWTNPQPVDTSGEGHEVMPALSFAGGKLMMIWYDQRNDISQDFDKWIQEKPGQPRHTLDVRVAQAQPGRFPVFEPSVQVSRYIFALTGQGPQQVQFNPVNFPLFKAGTWPFMGDYIDIAPSPMFVRHRSGHWIFNTKPSNSIVFHAAWTDNRDVRPPPLEADGSQDWTNYAPPFSTQTGEFELFQDCSDWERTGMRNQNIYTSRITQGIIVGSPQNTKPLGTLGYTPDGQSIPRAFVVFVHNTTKEVKCFRLTIMNQPPNGRASFLEFEPLYELDVSVAPYSSISRPVFVDSTDPKATVRIEVTEIYEPYGELIPGGLEGSVTLNPDPTNPDIENPDIENPDIENPDIENFEVHNPDIENPDIINWNYDILNPDILNPDILNPDILNPDILNPDIINPDIENPDILNPDIENPDILNPDILNPDILNPSFGDLTDVIWRVTNVGNTTSSYQFRTISSAAEADGTLPGGIMAQLLIYKVYSTPAEFGSSNDPCSLREKEHHELILNIVNPDIENPDIENPDIENPDIENPDIENATFALAPEEEALVVLRLWEPTSSISGLLRGTKTLESGEKFDPGTDIIALTWSHEGNTEDRQEGNETNPGDASDLIVATTDADLNEGTVGDDYSDFLSAYGGEEPYTWQIIGGSLPSGLYLDPNTGEIWGQPDTAGNSGFTAQVTDYLGDMATQDLHIIVRPAGGGDVLTITTDSELPDGAVGTPLSETITIQHGTPPYTWESDPLPAGLSISNGVISGTPTEAGGPFGFNVVVRDSSTPQQVANQDFYITILGQLGISTTSVADGVLGNIYSETLFAEGGTETYTWEFVSGTLPLGLDLTSDGVISGTPETESGNYPKTYTFTVQVTDDGPPLQTASKQLTIRIAQTLDITTNALIDGIGGIPYAGGAMAATGGILPYSWSSDPLPSGLYLNEETGEIWGTPDQPWGPGFITIRVTDASTPEQSAGKEFDLTIRLNTTLPGIMHWWTGDGDEFDIVGGKHVTLQNGTQFAAGMSNLGFYFDGVDDSAVATGLSIDNWTGLTFETWVYHNSLPNEIDRYVTLGNIDPNKGERFVLRHNGSGQLHFFISLGTDWGNFYNVTVDDVLNVGCFNHVAGTYNGSEMILYLNGIEIGRLSVAGVISTSDFMQVELSSPGECIDGLIDEVKAYSRALNPVEIQALYLSGGAGKCVWPLEITTTSLPDGEADQAYSQTLEVTGGIPPYTWIVESGDLPTGLSLSSEGVLSGTPTEGGSFSFVAEVTDSNLTPQTIQQQYSINIIADYILTGTLIHNGQPISNFTTTENVSFWGIDFTHGGTWPAPSPVYDNTTGTYTIPDMEPGEYYLDAYVDAEPTLGKWFPGDYHGVTGNFVVAEGDYSVNENIDLTFFMHLTQPFDNNSTYGYVPGEPPPQPYGPYRTHTSTILFRCDPVPGADTYSFGVWKFFTDGSSPEYIESISTVSTEHTFILPVSGANDYYHCSISARAGSNNIAVVMMKYENGYGGGYQFKVVNPIGIATTILKSAYKTGDYLDTLQAIGGSPPYYWSMISGSLPDGLSIMNGNEIRGTVSQSAVTSTFTVQVVDSGLPVQTDTKSLTITVNDPLDLGIFVDTGNMVRARRDHTATLLPNGKVLIVGWSQEAELYDPATGTFSSAGNSYYSHGQHSTATRLQDGRVLIVGGNGNVTSAEIYDPATGIFSPTGNLNQPHEAHSATLLPGGRVLIAAGGDNNSESHAFAELYDPSTDQFTMTGSLNEDRYLHTATLLSKGKVLITGGSRTTEPGYSVRLTSAELYDPTTGTFSFTDSLSVGRSFHSATLLQDGRVLVLGSAQSAELYDPTTETFSLTDEMNEERGAPYATLLPSGLVLITGGHTSGTVLNSAELYFPEIESFIIADSMSTPRLQHKSTLLNDGRVLVTGGYEGTTETAIAELYTEPGFGGLMAFYPFNGNADDQSGNGYHGTVNGATLTTDRFGIPNSAYYFDGANDTITSAQDDFAENNNLTVSLWVKIPGQVALRYFGMCSDFGIFQEQNNVGLAISLPSTNNAKGQIVYGEWHHFAGTYDGSTIRAYIDGSLAEEKSWPGNISDLNRVLTFGYFNNSYWEGYLDDVRIYNRKLSTTEIEALYAAESPGD